MTEETKIHITRLRCGSISSDREPGKTPEPAKPSSRPRSSGLSMVYFPQGDLFLENYTFEESAFTNRAAILSKNKIQCLDSRNSQERMEASGCRPPVSRVAVQGRSGLTSAGEVRPRQGQGRPLSLPAAPTAVLLLNCT